MPSPAVSVVQECQAQLFQWHKNAKPSYFSGTRMPSPAISVAQERQPRLFQWHKNANPGHFSGTKIENRPISMPHKYRIAPYLCLWEPLQICTSGRTFLVSGVGRSVLVGFGSSKSVRSLLRVDGFGGTPKDVEASLAYDSIHSPHFRVQV